VTQEEIRKLLGGYAANTLTESERTSLYEAALEDQDLFNALHNEDQLRELLADPVTREQVRQALEPAPRRAFWTQPWLIGVASVGVAGIIAIIIVTSHREPVATSVPTQMAQSRIEPKLEATKPEAPKPAPAVPTPERQRAARLVARSDELAARSTELGARPAPGLALADVASAPLYQGPLVRYSVLRGGPAGDAVRIEVVSQRAGSLALYRIDAAGQWQRVFPATGPGLPIAANTSYQIPDDPIAIRAGQEKLRLVITPATVSRLGGQLAAGALAAPRAKALEQTTAAPSPLVVEIPIGPN
jgi:hypothetical protein